MLLHIDPARLGAEVRYENLEGGEQQFPHVYGAIPASAVVHVAPFLPGADGTFGGPVESPVPDVDPATPHSS